MLKELIMLETEEDKEKESKGAEDKDAKDEESDFFDKYIAKKSNDIEFNVVRGRQSEFIETIQQPYKFN